MRVIIINPWDQTVTEDQHNGDYRDYYRLLSGPTLEGLPDSEVSCFCITELGDKAGHVLFVDDEGLFAEPQAFFTLGTQGATFAGRGVIARSDGGEDETGATLSLDAVRANVRWLPIGAVVQVPPPIIETFDSFESLMAKMEAAAGDRRPLLE